MASRNFDGFVEILDRVIVDKRVTYVAVGLEVRAPLPVLLGADPRLRGLLVD